MKIGGMGGLEIVIILIVVLLIFGPKNLPKLGSAIGKTMSNLRSGMNEGKKKKEEEEAAAAGNEATASETAATPAPPEIEGVVEDVEFADDARGDAYGDAQNDVIEEAQNAAAAAETTADEAFQTKKVKRVVKKKVD